MRIIAILFILMASPMHAEETPLLDAPWREEFHDLGNWEPLYFKKIPQHSSYQCVTEAGRSVLRCESKASASGIVLRKTFDPRALPALRFTWRVDQIYEGADSKKKSGDDYPLRIYILFQQTRDTASWTDRILAGLYGQLPPHSVLNYVWASIAADGMPYTSPYTSRAKMIPLQSGASRLGQWIEEKVEILADYRRVFGQDPPPGEARLAVMNDSDNTGLASVSWLAELTLDRDASSTRNP